MALLIYVLRYYLYIPLLITMEKKTSLYQNGLTEEVKKYWNSIISKVSFPCKSEEEILTFLNWLSEINQTPKDWDGNYYDKVDYSDEKSPFLSQDELYDRKLQYIDNQNQLVKVYLDIKGISR